MKRFFRKLISLCLVCVLCVGAYFALAGYAMFKSATKDMSVTEKVKQVRQGEDYVTLDQVPDIYEAAVICAEDQRFYDHFGIDLIALTRAVFRNIKDGEISMGGSSITQQLAKNLFFSHEKTFVRKAAELFAVYELEDNFGKNVILELYINTVYYGDGYYCIKDAANGYFHCEPEEMSDYECTLLAGVPNAPSVYAPTKNPDLAAKRQEYVLERMVKCGAIDKAKKDEILSDK